MTSSPADAPVIGRVQAIALRSSPRTMPRAVSAAQAIAGLGLADDRHADALSPRQVLLAGAPAYARHGLAPHTLRENLLLDVDTSTFASGTLLRVGRDAVLRLTFACEACGYLDARQPGIAAAIGRARGMLARVVHGGAIAAGDPVAMLPTILPAWDDDWRTRVAAILALVPPGMVVDYRHLARLAGVQTVYCRAFPRLARSLGFGHAAVAMASQPQLPRWQGHELFDEPFDEPFHASGGPGR
ncbi:hypothetical protein EWM63_23650 [Pseudoduganella lutea]|uniref:MOSC domain-containing protein n=1 Tax=Pseudoduganella lutea TaxID=321985 RepID=A0A4P6L6X7_9BURK|nr:hypothetical protein EWM63_23650 [Pseudoduganella lutea]